MPKYFPVKALAFKTAADKATNTLIEEIFKRVFKGDFSIVVSSDLTNEGKWTIRRQRCQQTTTTFRHGYRHRCVVHRSQISFRIMRQSCK